MTGLTADTRHRLCSLSGQRAPGLPGSRQTKICTGRRRAKSFPDSIRRRETGRLVPHSPEGACGTLGRFTAPAAPGIPTRNRHSWRPAHRAKATRCSREQWEGPASKSPLEGSPPQKQVLRPAFRTRMDFAACCMPQGAPFRRRVPVRASCRPDMHLGRPPVAPVSPDRQPRIDCSTPKEGARAGIVAATAARSA